MKSEKKNILIIDDNADIRKILTLYLEDNKFNIFSASDGLYGIQIFHEEKIDLIICDMIMPISDGIEVILKIKKEDPEIRIIAISGGGKLNFNDYLPLAKDFGADAILYKPFTKNDLLKTIQSIGDFL